MVLGGTEKRAGGEREGERAGEKRMEQPGARVEQSEREKTERKRKEAEGNSQPPTV